MKAKEYFLTKKGQKIEEDPKYLEEEKKILTILLNGRKNVSEILKELEDKGLTGLNWYKVEKWLQNLKKENLVEIFQ